MREEQRKTITENTLLTNTKVGCERWNMCRSTLIEEAKKAGALLKVGRRNLIIVSVMDEHMIREYKV